MSACAVCTSDAAGGLCPYHVGGHDEWSTANRILCDLLHRGQAPTRLTPEERNDGWVGAF